MSEEIRNVFISHVHEDDGALADVRSLLATRGYTIRDGSIHSGKPNEAQAEGYIKSEILAPQINWASTMIVVISPTTHKSEWVNWEIEYAEKQGKRIIGVWLQGAQEADVPEALKLYADAVVGWQADRVIGAIEGEINNWCDGDDSVRPAQALPRYSC